MIKGIKIYFFFGILISLINGHAFAGYEIIFQIDDKTYTNIDLENRTEYLKVINNTLKNKEDILEDLISVLIFNHYAKINNYKIDSKNIEKYLDEINKNNKLSNENIKKNLIYDIQRQYYLEFFFNNKKINFTEIKNINNSLYNYNIKFFTINDYDEHKKKIKLNKLRFLDLEEDKKYLDLNKISYQFNDKSFEYEDNISKDIKKLIDNNDKRIFIKKNDYLMIGIIKRNFKKNIKINLSLKKINLNKKINTDKINCNNLDSISQNDLIDIKNFNDIEIGKINTKILNNINFINDIVFINDREFIILCDIKYDIINLEKIIINKRIENIVNKIEKNFIREKSIEYNVKLYK